MYGYNNSNGGGSNNPQERYMQEMLAQQQVAQQQMMQQQMMAQQQMTQQQMVQNQMAQQQMMEQKEYEKRMKQMARLQNKQSELAYGQPLITPDKMPKATKGTIEEFLSYQIGVAQDRLNFVKVPEEFDKMKHCCTQGGVQLIEVTHSFYFMNRVSAGLCKYCGTVHYCFDKNE